jgi:cytosine permease
MDKENMPQNGVQKDMFGDFANVKVPEDKTKSFYGMFLVFTGVLVSIAVLYGGAGLGNGLSAKDILIASVTGSVILGIVGALTAVIGANTRTSTYLLLRYPFGRGGSKLAGAAVSGIGCGIGWFFIQAYLFGTVFETISMEVFGEVYWIASAPVAAFWGACLMSLTAYFGYKGLAFLSYLAVPLFMILLLAGTYAAVTEAGGFNQAVSAAPEASITMSAAITSVIGMYVAGATITPDISRYAKSPKAGAAAWFLQVVVLQPVLMLCAGLLTLLTPMGDIAQAMAFLGMGLGALALIIFGQWTTNDNNLYNGSLAFANTVRISKKKITLIMGGIGAVLASLTAAGVFGADPFMEFLNQLGRFLPPIAGILIADYYIFRPYVLGIKDPKKRYVFGEGTEYSQWNWVGIISWVAGTIASPYLPGAVGFNSIAIAFVVYLVLATLAEKANIKYEQGSYIETSDGF